MSIMNDDRNIEEVELTEEETQDQYRANEDTFLEGLLDAARYTDAEELKIEITRKGRTYFTFSLHPLSESELLEIRKKYTKYEKNRRAGIKVAGEVDTAKYRASIIYNSTIDSDKAKIWDNRKLWDALRSQGKVIINALDVIEAVLLPGEKDRIMDAIDEFNGYGTDELQVETAKN